MNDNTETSIDDRFKGYITRELDLIDFGSVFDTVARKSEYCSGELLHILSLTFYSQLSKSKTDRLGEISSLEHLLSDGDKSALLTIPRLLYIIKLCWELRERDKRPKSYDNLYL